jgi:ABC-type glycerol-3-phosphate transport system substrate-binding protein
MSKSALCLVTIALLALAACSESKVETEKADTGSKVSIAIDGNGDRTETRTDVTIDGDTEAGKFELKLPGGIEAKINLPEGMGESGKFDIDGVGLYPGAKVRGVNVNASDAKTTKQAVVKISFSAPADAAVVADWYQQQFEAKQKTVTRSGETLSGTTDDGDAFTIALDAAGTGASKGLLTIIDHKDS